MHLTRFALFFVVCCLRVPLMPIHVKNTVAILAQDILIHSACIMCNTLSLV